MSKIKSPQEYFSTFTIGPDESWHQRCIDYHEYASKLEMKQKIIELNGKVNLRIPFRDHTKEGSPVQSYYEGQIIAFKEAIEILKK